MVHPMTILQVLVIVQIGNVIIADMNGKFLYLREQVGINVPSVTNNCFKQNNNTLYHFFKRQQLEIQL